MTSRIKPWPPAKDDDPELFASLSWSLYGDVCPWIPGKLYKVIKQVTYSIYLPRRVFETDSVTGDTNQTFLLSRKIIAEDHGVVLESADDAKIHLIEPGGMFMLLAGHYDDNIFSILFENHIGYVSRKALNLYGSAQIVYDEG